MQSEQLDGLIIMSVACEHFYCATVIADLHSYPAGKEKVSGVCERHVSGACHTGDVSGVCCTGYGSALQEVCLVLALKDFPAC